MSVGTAAIVHLACMAAAITLLPPPEKRKPQPIEEREIFVEVIPEIEECEQEEELEPVELAQLDAFPDTPALPEAVWVEPAGAGDSELVPEPLLEEPAPLDKIKPIQPARDDPARPRRARIKRLISNKVMIATLSGRGAGAISVLGTTDSVVSDVFIEGRGTGGLDAVMKGGFRGVSTAGGVAGGVAYKSSGKAAYRSGLVRRIRASTRWRKAIKRSKATRAVLLRVTVDSTGAVTRTRVIRSSGDTALDIAATKAAISLVAKRPPAAGSFVLKLYP